MYWVFCVPPPCMSTCKIFALLHTLILLWLIFYYRFSVHFNIIIVCFVKIISKSEPESLGYCSAYFYSPILFSEIIASFQIFTTLCCLSQFPFFWGICKHFNILNFSPALAVFSCKQVFGIFFDTYSSNLLESRVPRGIEFGQCGYFVM